MLKLIPISILSGALVILASISPSFAQSIDRDNPTPLTTKMLANPGRADQDTVYYYSLTVRPGKITITVDSDAGKDNDAFATTVRLETPDGENLLRADAVSSPGFPNRTVESAEFDSETPVVLLLSSSGHHRIKIEGNWKEFVPVVTQPIAKPYGPDTCKQGFVWREATADDRVCVTPVVRARTQKENKNAASRREPNGGDYGPNTCKQGYVWREAVANDVVCVTPKIRTQTAEDNRLAAERRLP